jgi:hypothetical protein
MFLFEAGSQNASGCDEAAEMSEGEEGIFVKTPWPCGARVVSDFY